MKVTVVQENTYVRWVDIPAGTIVTGFNNTYLIINGYDSNTTDGVRNSKCAHGLNLKTLKTEAIALPSSPFDGKVLGKIKVTP